MTCEGCIYHNGSGDVCYNCEDGSNYTEEVAEK